MTHELRKWLNIRSIVVILAVFAMNMIFFRQHMAFEDRSLLEDYPRYVALLEDQGSEEMTGGSGETAFIRQKNHIDRYPAFILEMPERAEDAMALSGDAFSVYSQRNIDKTVKDFTGLEQLPLELGRDYQVIRTFDFLLTDLVLIALVLVFVVQLFAQEYEDQLFPLLLATSSRARIAMDKILLMIILLIVWTLGLYGGNLVMAGQLYGWDHWGRMVQSIDEFRTVPFPLTVGGYFALAFLLKFVNAFILGIVTFALLTIVKKAIPMLAIIGVGWSVAYILYRRIPVNSVMNALRFINPIHGFNAYDLIRRYQNIRIFSYPVAMTLIWPVICIFVFFIGTGVIFLRFRSAAILRSSYSWRWFARCGDSYKRKVDQLNWHGVIIAHELKKALFSAKALLILLILVGLLWNSVDTSYRYADSNRMAYAQYVERFGGRATEATLEAIVEERDKLTSNSTGSFIEIELQALSRVQDQVEKVLQQEEEMDIPAYLLNDDVYGQLMDNSEADHRDVILAFTAAVLTGAGLFARENTVDAIRLLRITPQHRRIRGYKTFITVLLSFLCSLLVWIARYSEFSRFHCLVFLDAPIQNHFGWVDFPFAWSLGTYLRVMVTLRLLGGILLGFVVAAISARSKNESVSAVLAGALTVLPVIAVSVGIREVQYFTLGWIAEANNLLYGSLWGWGWAMLLFIAVITGSLWSIKTEWQPQV